MSENPVKFYQMPEINNPILITGFEGWSNAGNIAHLSIDYIIEKMEATLIAEIDSDYFYQFSKNRPIIHIKDGKLQDLNPKRILFYFCRNKGGENDLILLKALEPDYRWYSFVRILTDLCTKWGVSLTLSIGGMHDDVLHTDTLISGIYSHSKWKKIFAKDDIQLINYKGPSGIHSLIMEKAEKGGIPFAGLWGHSPLYLGGTNFRLALRIIKLIASLFHFSIDTDRLETSLQKFELQIEKILEQNSELQEYMNRVKINRTGNPGKKDKSKIINIKDFVRHKEL